MEQAEATVIADYVNQSNYSSSIKQPKELGMIDDVMEKSLAKAEGITKFTSKFGKGMIALVAGAAILDGGMNYLETAKSNRTMKKQNEQVTKQREDEYEKSVRKKNMEEGMYYNLNQDLYASRKGSSNTWGGRKY